MRHKIKLKVEAATGLPLSWLAVWLFKLSSMCCVVRRCKIQFLYWFEAISKVLVRYL